MGRPFRAFSDFTKEFNYAIEFSSPTAKAIFEWFKTNTKPGSHAIGAMFTGSFYYDACFWPLQVLHGYGEYKLNALDSLETMPSNLKEQLAQSHQGLGLLMPYPGDCVDYAYGLDDIIKLKQIDARALSFIENGSKELVGAIVQLNILKPNMRAVLNLKMACEIFLKALLIQEKELTEGELKKLGHSIENIAKKCYEVTNVPEFEIVQHLSSIFPDVSERYDGDECKSSKAWDTLCVTQTAVTAVVRQYSDRDIRPQLFKK